MTEYQHHELREFLGAYVLGALSPADTDAVRGHLSTCPDCRAELAALQPVASALAGLRRRPAAGAPPAALAARIDAVVTAEATSRRRSSFIRSATGLVAAAALVVAAVLGVRALSGTEPTAPVPTAIDVQVAADQPEVTASAGIVAHTWGVEVKLTAVGLTAGENFEAYVVGEDGQAVPAGTFVGVGENTMNCNLQSFLMVDDALGFEIRDDADNLVISGDF